jgi:hypothetical protein
MLLFSSLTPHSDKVTSQNNQTFLLQGIRSAAVHCRPFSSRTSMYDTLCYYRLGGVVKGKMPELSDRPKKNGFPGR